MVRSTTSAAQWLAPGGQLLVETSKQQARRTADVFAGSGLTPHIAWSDELDATIVIGTVNTGGPPR